MSGRRVLRFCKTQSRHVNLAHDTDSGLFSVFVYRHNRGALGRYLDYVRPGKVYDATVRAAIDYHIDLQLWNELHSFLNGIRPCAAISLFSRAHLRCPGRHGRGRAGLSRGHRSGPERALAIHSAGLSVLATRRCRSGRRAAERAVELAPAKRRRTRRGSRSSPPTADCRRLVRRSFPCRPVRCRPRCTAMSPTIRRPPWPASDRAIEKTPAYLPAHVARADLLERMGRVQEALAEWELTQRMAPNDRSIASRREALSRRK